MQGPIQSAEPLPGVDVAAPQATRAPPVLDDQGCYWTAYLPAAPMLDEAERKRQICGLLERELEAQAGRGSFTG